MTYEIDTTSEQKLLVDAIRDFCKSEVQPHVREWDEAEITPVDVIKKMADLGLWGMLIPEKYDGNDVGFLSYVLAVEELSRWSPALAIAISVHNSVSAGPIQKFGTEEQKKIYLPRLAHDDFGSFCLTEPSAGSDAAALKSTAKREGDHYLLNGTKIYVTNGDISGIYIVMAKTQPDENHRGISAFIVERDAPGFTIGTKEKKMGLRASGTVEIVLEDCRVPVANRLGEEGQGFKVAMSALDEGRIGVGAQALGLARAAFEDALGYAKTRIQFGEPISKKQAIRWKFANMATEISAARLLVLRAAELADRGERVTQQAAMAKVYASEMVQRVTNEAVQIHGGYGYIREYSVERAYRDARVMTLYEGTSEIQRHVIAREVLED